MRHLDEISRCAVHTVCLAAAVFACHVFQKKAKRGIATPRQDTDLIEERLKAAEHFENGLAR